ncbi:MAG: 3-ketoacyl-ACP reductase [Chloroflexi bacterium RBG_16_54_18]|nr:MAG: 3-ketoacyl-ACP reductase [Chloroflexi bacterium RBG_16_54_18]
MENTGVALVTGSSRGIGRAIALDLGKHGWRVGINYRSDRAAAQTCLAEIEASGGQGTVLQADISDLAAHQGLLQGVLERFGRLDLLVNNAGIPSFQRRDLLELEPGSYDQVLSTNLRGPFFLTQRIALQMIDQVQAGAGRLPQIVNIGSISGEAASTNRAEYCLSKAGLGMMTRLFAVRLASHGINVYEVRPGIIATDMTAAVKAKYDRLILEEGLTLLPRWGQPADVARIVTAIASGALPYSTGEIIYVDGGMHNLHF